MAQEFSEENIINTIRQYGMNDYEARAYWTLLKHGSLTAREVAELANLPASKIYVVLNELMNKGVIATVLGRPKKYKPIQLSDALDKLIEYKRRRCEIEIKNLTKNKEILEKYISEIQVTVPEKEESEFFQEIRGREFVHKKIIEMIDSTEEEFIAITSANGLYRAFKVHKEALERAKKRGVRLRYMTPVNNENIDVAREFSKIVELKAIEKAPIKMSIWDKKETILFQIEPDDLGLEDKPGDKGIWIRSRKISSLLYNLFDHTWNSL